MANQQNATVVSQITSNNYSGNNAATVYIQMRRKTSSEWIMSRYVPLNGEPCFESDSYRYKIGDGISTWDELPYAICGVDDGELE